MIRVLGIDPGGTTGLAVLNYTNHWGTVPLFWQEPAASSAIKAARLLEKGTWDAVAMERFVVGQRAGRSRTAGAGQQARDIIGAVTHLCQEHGVPLVDRTASQAKAWATDRRLDAAGLLTPTKGIPHARDAVRHALYAAVWDLGCPDPLSTRE